MILSNERRYKTIAHKKKEKIKGLYTVIDKYTHKELARNLTREAIQFIFPSDWEEFSEDIIVIKQV